MVVKDQETWKSAIEGTIFITRFDHRGEFAKQELVPPGKVIHLSTEERKLNQEKAADESLDLFSNGMLTPVRILDTADDAREIAANPNLLTESDMKKLVGVHYKTLEAKLKTITNLTTLDRMVEMAIAEDVAVSKVGLIRHRRDELDPLVQQQPDDRGRETGSSFRAVTPR